MTIQEALKFWEWRYENAKDYYDDHWEADERRSHREYVEALEWAVKTLADRKTEPLDKDINVRSKDEPQQVISKLADAEKSTDSACESTMSQEKSKLKDEPQTEEWHGDCNTCRWLPCCDYEPKDEPQTERSKDD